LIPTGEIATVVGTPLEFNVPLKIGSRIGSDFKALVQGKGYDHNYILRAGSGMRLAAKVRDPKSGRVMTVMTTEPGVQFYTGNHLKGVAGKGGHVYEKRHGFCLETQHYPDSPNQPAFPSVVLHPGDVYQSTTSFQFSAE
jgi:aldose 1-epimerase